MIAAFKIFAFFTTNPLGRWIGFALLAAGAIGGIYGKGYFDGKANVQAKWDAAVQAAIERGHKARTDAERDVGAIPDDGGVRHDQFQRD
jgi:hypothetical protein